MKRITAKSKTTSKPARAAAPRKLEKIDHAVARRLGAAIILKYAKSGCALGRRLRADPDFEELLALAQRFRSEDQRRTGG